ncbi:hypothetical protein Hanom_Chr01g00059031 [Helianthus anomalus]
MVRVRFWSLGFLGQHSGLGQTQSKHGQTRSTQLTRSTQSTSFGCSTLEDGKSLSHHYFR